MKVQDGTTNINKAIVDQETAKHMHLIELTIPVRVALVIVIATVTVVAFALVFMSAAVAPVSCEEKR